MHKVKFPKILQPFSCDNLIRLGKSNDGGYLVNKKDILASRKLISIGIGEDWSFEKDFTELNNCYVSAYDQTVNTTTDQYKEFFANNKQHFSKNVGNNPDNIKFADTLDHFSVFLKCDIEGNEYSILDELISYSSRFTGMIIEFHDINNNIESLFNFIAKTQLKLVHVHVNNYFYYKTERGDIPDILELSFTSGTNIKYNPELTLPHSLDMPNNPNDVEFEITF